jgi:methionyl-tRNA formyltransferase
VRVLIPYPTAYTFLNSKKLKVYAVEYSQDCIDLPAGKYQSDGKSYLKFGTSDGHVNIIDLQLEGKKRMKVDEFLRGYRLASEE